MQKDKSEQDETHSSSDFFEYYFPCFVFIFVESFIPLIVLLVCLFCRDLIILENDIFFNTENGNEAEESILTHQSHKL